MSMRAPSGSIDVKQALTMNELSVVCCSLHCEQPAGLPTAIKLLRFRYFDQSAKNTVTK